MTNAYDVQTKLKEMSCISVPLIRNEFGLDYSQALKFLRLSQRRGWVSARPNGRMYQVDQNYLLLKKITKRDVFGLINCITPDCASALMCIRDRAVLGASFGELSAAVHGDKDTKIAISILRDSQLIYKVNDLYFLRVSDQTVSVLCDAAEQKRKYEQNKAFGGNVGGGIAEIMNMFDVLFE